LILLLKFLSSNRYSQLSEIVDNSGALFIALIFNNNSLYFTKNLQDFNLAVSLRRLHYLFNLSLQCLQVDQYLKSHFIKVTQHCGFSRRLLLELLQRLMHCSFIGKYSCDRILQVADGC